MGKFQFLSTCVLEFLSSYQNPFVFRFLAQTVQKVHRFIFPGKMTKNAPLWVTLLAAITYKFPPAPNGAKSAPFGYHLGYIWGLPGDRMGLPGDHMGLPGDHMGLPAQCFRLPAQPVRRSGYLMTAL